LRAGGDEGTSGLHVPPLYGGRGRGSHGTRDR